MKNVSVRAAEPRDGKLYAEWLQAASKINLIDPKVYEYPTCNTAVVEKDGEPVLMNSFHLVLMMEALAPKPGISPLSEARALNALFDGVKGIAAASSVKEIWFGCADPTLQKFVEKHGIERVNFPMFRMKI